MPKLSRPNPDTEVLGLRTLNRTLLKRQLLLRRVPIAVPDLIERLVGMQAQVPNNPYVACWSRIEDFDPMQLSNLIENRGAVRLALLRATLHLVTADDALALRPVLHETMTRLFMKASPYGRQLAGVDFDALVAAGKEIVDARPCTYAQLGAELGPRWPDYDANCLTYGVHYLSPLVQSRLEASGSAAACPPRQPLSTGLASP